MAVAELIHLIKVVGNTAERKGILNSTSRENGSLRSSKVSLPDSRSDCDEFQPNYEVGGIQKPGNVFAL